MDLEEFIKTTADNLQKCEAKGEEIIGALELLKMEVIQDMMTDEEN